MYEVSYHTRRATLREHCILDPTMAIQGSKHGHDGKCRSKLKRFTTGWVAIQIVGVPYRVSSRFSLLLPPASTHFAHDISHRMTTD